MVIRIRKIGLCAALLGLAPGIKAQDLAAQDTRPYIEVTGAAETEIVPDEIWITIVLGERYEGKDKIAVDSQEAALRKVIAEVGAEEESLSLAAANADYVKVKGRQRDVLTRKEYTLKLRDALTVGRLFSRLDALDMDNAHIVKMSHSRIDSLKKETRIRAAKAAKEKAAYLLAAIGQQPGGVLIVREEDPGFTAMPESNPYAVNSRYKAEDGADSWSVKGNERVEVRKLRIQASVYIRYLVR